MLQKHPDHFRPVIPFYYPVRALTSIADGLLSLAAWPFGYWSDLHIRFVQWCCLEGIRRSVESGKKEGTIP
ncbi:MAG: hypothetical protein ABFE07_28130 [Armatimonadia bacterium]